MASAGRSKHWTEEEDNKVSRAVTNMLMWNEDVEATACWLKHMLPKRAPKDIKAKIEAKLERRRK